MIFENVPKFANIVSTLATQNDRLLYFHVVDIPNNINFNTVVVPLCLRAWWNYGGNPYLNNQTQRMTLNVGLYSLTGSTLTLMNSASVSKSSATTGQGDRTFSFLSWFTLVTSAVSLITPGNWFLASRWSGAYTTSYRATATSASATNWGSGTGTSGTALMYVYPMKALENTNVYINNADVFFRGSKAATTSALPASIATSDLVKNHSPYLTPYILISD